MDVERTIEHILKLQAKAEARAEKADARMDRAEARMDRLDRQMEGIQKLVRQGMRMLARNQTALGELIQAQKRTDQKLAELTQAQKATDKSLKAFIDSLRHGRNGRNNR